MLEAIFHKRSIPCMQHSKPIPKLMSAISVISKMCCIHIYTIRIYLQTTKNTLKTITVIWNIKTVVFNYTIFCFRSKIIRMWIIIIITIYMKSQSNVYLMYIMGFNTTTEINKRDGYGCFPFYKMLMRNKILKNMWVCSLLCVSQRREKNKIKLLSFEKEHKIMNFMQFL